MNRPKLLSAAYKKVLGKKVPEEVKEKLKLEDDANWAEAIAEHVAKNAVGVVNNKDISFAAISELRESTEGKTPEKIIAAGTNEELTNLAAIMNGPPAELEKVEEEPEPGDSTDYNPEEDFHHDSPSTSE
jgi:CO dehydrogenase/acetyl-CoA synthase beta subunit